MMLRRILLGLVPFMGGAWLLGAVARDRGLITSAAYYIPAVVVVGFGCLWLALTRRGARGPAALAVAAVTVTALLKVLVVDIRRHPEQTRRPGALRVTHWNVAHGRLGTQALARSLARDRADVCVLSECPGEAATAQIAARVFPQGHHVQESGMAVFSRFRLEALERVDVGAGQAWCVRVSTRPVPLDLLAVDLVSTPWRSRRGRLEALARWVEGHEGTIPLLVLGDFNTPRDSVHFEPLRRQLFHGYELAGHGWPYTWPVPFPVYAIDHIWVSRRARVHGYALRTAWCSDHRRQVIDISLKPIRPGRP